LIPVGNRQRYVWVTHNAGLCNSHSLAEGNLNQSQFEVVSEIEMGYFILWCEGKCKQTTEFVLTTSGTFKE
jgi:hypothetical protein